MANLLFQVPCVVLSDIATSSFVTKNLYENILGNSLDIFINDSYGKNGN